MPDAYATEFADIPFALANNGALRAHVEGLIAGEPIPGKVTEGAGRVDALRAVLTRIVHGDLAVGDAIAEVERALPPTSTLR